jgi:hypothetical protein
VPALKKLLQATTVPARLFSLTVFNTNAGPQYVQIFDKASAPSGGDVPKIQVKVLGDDDRSVDYGDGRIFKYGIFIGISSSPGTYAAAAADDCLIDCTFRRGS